MGMCAKAQGKRGFSVETGREGVDTMKFSLFIEKEHVIVNCENI